MLVFTGERQEIGKRLLFACWNVMERQEMGKRNGVYVSCNQLERKTGNWEGYYYIKL